MIRSSKRSEAKKKILHLLHWNSMIMTGKPRLCVTEKPDNLLKGIEELGRERTCHFSFPNYIEKKEGDIYRTIQQSSLAAEDQAAGLVPWFATYYLDNLGQII